MSYMDWEGAKQRIDYQFSREGKAERERERQERYEARMANRTLAPTDWQPQPLKVNPSESCFCAMTHDGLEVKIRRDDMHPSWWKASAAGYSDEELHTAEFWVTHPEYSDTIIIVDHQFPYDTLMMKN